MSTQQFGQASLRRKTSCFKNWIHVTLILCFLLCSCTSVQVPKSKNNIRLAPAPYFDSNTGIYFPGAIGTLHRHSVVQLEERSPGLGVALSYREQSSKLDIFTYDLQAPLIPNGANNQIVQRSFDEALENIQKAAERGLYTNFKIESAERIKIADQYFLSARVSYGENLIQKEAYLFVSGVNGQILKVRAAIARPSDFNIDQAIKHLESVIQYSRRSGYGCIDQVEFDSIERSLKEINLEDGMSVSEALAIAQMKLINSKKHSRYNPLLANINTSEQDVFSIQFQPYAINPFDPNQTNIRIVVSSDGESEIVNSDPNPFPKRS